MENKEEILDILRSLYNDISNSKLLTINTHLTLINIIDNIANDSILQNKYEAELSKTSFIEIINKLRNKIDIQYSQVEKVLDYFENCYAIAALQ